MNYTRKYNQCATYWGTPTTNGFGGLIFALPKEIRVRWEDKQEKFLTASGDEALCRAVVYTLEDIEIGGYLYLGETTEADPTQFKDAHPIRQFMKTPDIQNLQNTRKVYL